MPSLTAPTLDAELLATQCRALVRERYKTTSCIESAFLFERTAYHLGHASQRVVCQATAMSPAFAKAAAEGLNLKELMGTPGFWAVAVGEMQFPGDFVGRVDIERNRYVGHVVCLADGHLVDPSVDQMSRPAKDLNLETPLVCEYDGQGPVAVGVHASGSVVRYVLHPEVTVPEPRTDKILERLARGLAQQWVAKS